MIRHSRVFMLMIVFALSTGLGSPAAHGEQSSSGATKELERIKNEMLEKKGELKRASRKERSVLADLDKIDRDIQTGSAELVEQQRRLDQAEVALRDSEASSASISRDLEVLKRLYAIRLRALYKMRHNGSTVLSIPDGLVKQIKYLGIIAERDQTVIRDYGSALIRLTLRQTDLAAKKAEILERRRIVETKRAELEAKKRRKSAMLASIRQEKTVYTQTLHELEDASVSLWAMIKKDEQKRRALQMAPLPVKRNDEAPGGGSGRLPWPVEGQVITRFGMQRHPRFGTMVFRRGIEIEAREGESVRAVDDGQVAYADWYKGYGELVILDHGNGFYTLYGNLSRLDFAKGAHVARGQVIGLAGDTGSLKGTKLYFEIRRNGQAQDPLLWLSPKQTVRR